MSRFGTFLTCAVVTGCVVGHVHAGTIISDAVKIQGNNTPINLLDGGLVDGVDAYTDRTHVLVNIPAGLVGADLVQVSNDDKTSNPYQVDVTVGQLGLIYVGLDDRLTTSPLPWMDDTASTGLPTIFYDTGAQIDIDESADGSIDQTFSMYVAFAPPGTYHLLQQDDGGGRNMYIILGSDTVVVPEPGALTLAALGLLAFIGISFRRR